MEDYERKILVVTRNDKNYATFYNFWNNSKKFLEIFLYYKYPDDSEDIERYKKFFGEEIPAILADRMNNEYSHLSATFERGSRPALMPKMKTVAEQIIKRIKETDKDRYDSLLKSIGITQ